MKRISVMLVDDEKLVLEDLRSLVDWDKLGFEIVTTAFNGKQAWVKYNQYHPQVIFTDIKMPFLDGLEFVRKVREVDNEVSILLLTAYEDFTYARMAIQYGIMDYVIKSTLDEVSLAGLLKKIYKKITEKGQVKNILTERKISEYLEEKGQEAGEQLAAIDGHLYGYLVIEQDMPVPFTDESLPQSFLHSKSELADILELESSSKCEVIAVSYMQNMRILVVLDIPGNSQKDFLNIISTFARKIKERIYKTFEQNFSIYILDHKASLREFKKLRERYYKKFYEKYFTGCDQILWIEEIIQEETSISNDMQKISILKKALNKNDKKGVQEYLRECYRSLNNAFDYKGLKRISRELYEFLKYCYKEEGIYDQDLGLKNNYRDWMDSSGIEMWFEQKFELLIQQKEKTEVERYSKSVRNAMDYIWKNYGKHALTLKEIAEAVHLSVGHLCGLFKKETGKTLNSYITEIRMKEAKRLLEEENMKVYEVADTVGYQSSQYFSQIFFKFVGTYPTNYQKERERP